MKLTKADKTLLENLIRDFFVGSSSLERSINSDGLNRLCEIQMSLACDLLPELNGLSKSDKENIKNGQISFFESEKEALIDRRFLALNELADKVSNNEISVQDALLAMSYMAQTKFR